MKKQRILGLGIFLGCLAVVSIVLLTTVYPVIKTGLGLIESLALFLPVCYALSELLYIPILTGIALFMGDE